MNKYHNGKIYTIRNKNDDSLIYVGSTIQSLSQRWAGHKIDSLKNPHFLIYSSINNNWNDWYIELYEECKCDNKEQLNKREGEVIRQIATLNKQIAGRTNKQYRETHKDEKKEYDKRDREVNADKIREKITCECGSIICNGELSRHKKTKKHLYFIQS